MPDRFTIRKHRDYIELLYDNKPYCNCDNEKEVEEEIRNKRGY